MKRLLGAAQGVGFLAGCILITLGLFTLGRLAADYPIIGWIWLALLFAAAAVIGAATADSEQ